MSQGHVLQLDESVELCHAWLQHLATDLGIRILLIKGPALHRMGLRELSSSTDVDVLVEPDRFDEFCAALEAGGWVERDRIFITALRGEHARTYFHANWPSDIDAHYCFPGFLASPATVFEELWGARTTLVFGHRECDVPNRPASVILLALNDLRSARERVGSPARTGGLTADELSGEERAAVAELAISTGSAATLATVLPALGVVAEPSPEELASNELRVWRRWIVPGRQSAYLWLSALSSSGWKQRGVIVWHAVWPTRHDLLVARPDTRDTLMGRLIGRSRRLVHGMQLTGALVASVAKFPPTARRRR